ncbi:serine/threonine-protein kinase [Streptomyces geranii]|uniref:serine/threonine-protein kinase n=1 Tax=Streptomyces geranii TaxID=2058923 RepID=UPI000D041931|nr:serine/threonine-protein kinase [Streptomyces geranii]
MSSAEQGQTAGQPGERLGERKDGTGRLLAGRYRVVGQLGRGGMGIVWRAVDEVLGREVAVKELRTFTDAAAPELAALRLRMKREARAAARIRHTGVVAVHDVAEVDGRPLIVMELVEGRSLDAVLAERGTLDPREAARIGAQVMDALAAAHRVGVLHRDVKPGNILLEASGRVVLTDFGIARMEDPGDGSDTNLTRSGELVGSLDYLAPERAQGNNPVPASDIWALGATLYAAVEGASPFRRTSTWSTLTAIVAEPLPDCRQAGALGPVLRLLMDKQPEERPDAATARGLLETVATSEPGTTERLTTELRRYGAAGAVASDAYAGVGDGDLAEPSGPAVPPGFGPAEQVPPAAGAERHTPTPGFGPPEPLASGTPGFGPADPLPAPAGPSDPTSVSTQAPVRPHRKARVLLAAAAVTVVLGAAGTTVALVGSDDDTKARAGAKATTDSRVVPPATGTGDSEPEPSAEDTPTGKDTPSSPNPNPTPDDGAETTDPGDSATPSPSRSTDSGTTGGGGTGATPSADDTPACESIGAGKYNCTVWRTAKSYDAAGTEVGVLKAGTNYFFCQEHLDRRETAGEWTNTWWARTDDDSGNTDVHVSVVYIQGGDNDLAVPGLPVC